MSASSRGTWAVSALRRGRRAHVQGLQWRQTPHVPSRRAYSASPVSQPVESGIPPTHDPAVAQPVSAEAPPYQIRSGVILTRAPLLTRELTPFEAAFFLYQKRLNERLCAPFRRRFYFRPDTAADLDWRIKIAERRGTPGRDIGEYQPGVGESWNDEALVGSELASHEGLVERLLADAEMRVSEDGERLNEDDRVPVERPQPRRTEADNKGDVRRLDRELDRTLYFVVEGQDGSWGFPTAAVEQDENLHQTAARALAQTAGVNMNTWMVGRAPVAHFVEEPVPGKAAGASKDGVKTFFLKARIMAGQADLSKNAQGATDFKWLTRQELETQLAPEYLHRVRNTMADR